MRAIDISGEEVFNPGHQPQPRLEMVQIADLRIDELYQRELRTTGWRKIRKIASEFRWSRFTPILCAPTGDGHLAIIDGQHRVHAAALCEYVSVPAMIVDMNETEQATAFVAVNGNVTKTTTWHIFKAALAAGEDWAADSNDAVVRAGCRLMTFNSSTNMKKSGEIYAVNLVRQLVSQGHADRITAGLAALMAYDSGGRVALYSAMILRPWLTALCELDDIEGLDLTAFLKANNPFLVVERVARLRTVDDEYRKKTSATVERQAFVALLRAFARRAAA